MNHEAVNPYGVEGYDASTYGDSFAEVYDQWYAHLDDADFLSSITADLPTTSQRVLELGVGTGRLVAQWLSLRPDSHDIFVGVDSSSAMLKIAHNRHFPPSVSLVAGDFSEYLPEGPFDVIFVGYNTLFNLPDMNAVQSCMSLVASRLAPHGSFYIDAVIPRSTDDSTHEVIQTMATGEEVVARSQHDSVNQRISGTFTHLAASHDRTVRSWSICYVMPEQIDAIAEKSGLSLFTRYADGRQAAFTEDSHRHISRYSPTV